MTTALLPASQPSARALRWAAALGVVAVWAVLQAVVLWRIGAFEYPLDDVYIHLAMASGIAHGTYGVNLGESASAASSALFPLLLLPFPDSELQRLLPAFWNLVGGLACGALWGQVVHEAGLRGRAAWGVALGGVVALNLGGVAFVGMEHSLHTAVALAGVLGLWHFLRDGRLSWWFATALILSPLLRLEGLALSLGAAGVVALRGRPGTGLALMAAILLPVAGFMLFLTSLGLSPLPSSVLTKISTSDPDWLLVDRLIVEIAAKLRMIEAKLLAALLLTYLPLIVLLRGPVGERSRLLMVTVFLAGLAHLVFGQFGWLNRYETYIVASLIAAALLGGSVLEGRGAQIFRAICILAMLLSGAVLLGRSGSRYLDNPRAVYLQQTQMARFAQDFLKEPVAVNDLGRVAWGNEAYVLDLWGLASQEARLIRLQPGGAPDGWMVPLMETHGVRYAMVYDRWLPAQARGPGMVRMATLTMRHPRGQLGGYVVNFFATSQAAADAARPALIAFARSLPADAILTIGNER